MIFVDYNAAVFAHLTADAALSAKINLLAETIPDGTPFPFIWIEDGGQKDWSTKSENGIEAEMTFHVASRYNGNKEVREIQNLLHGLLHYVTLTLVTGQSVLCMFDRAEIILDQDGLTRHGIIRFKLLLSEV